MNRRDALKLSILTGAGVAATSVSGFAKAPKIAMEEMMVPSSDPGIKLYVRNKRPAGMKAFRPDRTVLFLHGATYGSSSSFDLMLDGFSWMDYIASRGYDVWLLDLRGYGKSTPPKEMSEKPEANPPIARADTAIKDIGVVVDFILAHRKIPRLDLLGWSAGAFWLPAYAAENPAKVERLALYAPIWIRQPAPPASGPLGAYRTVTRDQAFQRWMTGVPDNKKSSLIPNGWFDRWADATWAADTEGAKANPPVIRAPNGVLQDAAEYWSAGKPYYDPAKITAPTLLIGAEWDRDAPPYMAQALFPLLINSPGKRYVQLAEGTHTIMMEKNRLSLFEAVQAFLDK